MRSKYLLVVDWLRQGAHECWRCRHFRSDRVCVARCPTMKYSDNSSVCRPCHPHCHWSSGCTGPGNGVGPGRCLACTFVKLDDDQMTVLECLDPDTEQCEPGYYLKTYQSPSRSVRNVVTLVLIADNFDNVLACILCAVYVVVLGYFL